MGDSELVLVPRARPRAAIRTWRERTHDVPGAHQRDRVRAAMEGEIGELRARNAFLEAILLNLVESHDREIHWAADWGSAREAVGSER